MVFRIAESKIAQSFQLSCFFIFLSRFFLSLTPESSSIIPKSAPILSGQDGALKKEQYLQSLKTLGSEVSKPYKTD